MNLNPNLLALSFVATLGLSAGISLARLTVKTFKARNTTSAAYHAIPAVFSLGIAVVSMIVMSPILQAEWAKTVGEGVVDMLTLVACLCACITGGQAGDKLAETADSGISRLLGDDTDERREP